MKYETLNTILLYLHFASKLKSFMNRIREVLDEKGIKQKWLAEQLGKSYNMVNSYIKNRQQPRIEVLFDIAKILNVEAKDLLIEMNNDNKNSKL